MTKNKKRKSNRTEKEEKELDRVILSYVKKKK